MKPPPFAYHDPQTLDEAVSLLSRLENAKLLAGGQSLMPMLNMRFVQPDHVVDLNRVADMTAITDCGDAIEIGAMVRQRDIEFSDVIRAKCPLIHEAILNVGHRQTRNRGTIGGSLCHLDPAGELVCMAAAFDATIHVVGPDGRRDIPFVDFVLGYMTPAIGDHDIVTSVRFPVWAPGHGYAFLEFARRHGDFAVVAVAAMLEAAPDGTIRRVSLALSGLDVAPRRIPEAEAMLVGEAGASALLDAVAELCGRLDALDDVHAPRAYRQRLARVLTRRALETALSRIHPIQVAREQAYGGI